MKKFTNRPKVSVNEVIDVINGYNKKEVIDLGTPKGRDALSTYVTNKIAKVKGISVFDAQMALRNANGEVLNTPNGLRDFIVNSSNGRIRNNNVVFARKSSRVVVENEVVRPKHRFVPKFVVDPSEVENNATHKFGEGHVLRKGVPAPKNSVVVYTKGALPMYWSFQTKPSETEINGLRSHYRKVMGVSYKDAHNIYGENYNKKMIG